MPSAPRPFTFCAEFSWVMAEKPGTITKKLPQIVAAADWSTDAKKRWMVRAERVDSAAYVVYLSLIRFGGQFNYAA